MEASAQVDKQNLTTCLLDAVKQCQIRFGGRSELATDSDSRVACLLTQFEAVLQHGLHHNPGGASANSLAAITTQMPGMISKVADLAGINPLKNLETEPVLWNVAKNILSKHECERYSILKYVHTDSGKGRAWLRSALNEHALERYMHMIVGDTAFLCQYYEEWAFLMDQERSSMLPMMAAGVGSILFALNIDNEELNTIRPLPQPSPIRVAQVAQLPEGKLKPVIVHNERKRDKKRKKRAPNIVDFDENNEQKQSFDSTGSANDSSLMSPASTTSSFMLPPSDTNLVSTKETTTADIRGAPADITDENDEFEDCVTSLAPGNLREQSKNNDLSKQPVVRFNQEESVTYVLEPKPCVDGQVENVDKQLDNSVENEEETGSNLCGSVTRNLFGGAMSYMSAESEYSGFSSTPSHKGANHRVSATEGSEGSVNGMTPVTGVGVGALYLVSADETQSEMTSASELSAQVLTTVHETPSTNKVLTKIIPSVSTAAAKEDRELLPMGSDELRQALVTMMLRKDEMEDQTKSLRNLLDVEMEISANLRQEINEKMKRFEDREERDASKLQALTRENELLKHQLRKYVGAVQMLRSRMESQEEISSIGVLGNIDPQPTIPDEKMITDYSHEASEYERKLIQVAEMHGELMEFNDRLHRQLNQKEVQLRRITEELVELRGPLPDDNGIQSDDDNVSVTSDLDASTSGLRPLINIWIPSAFLCGRSSDAHHVYQIYIRIRDEEWNVYRRYAHFYEFHTRLKKKNPIVNTFDFPPKKTLRNKDSKLVEDRRRRLQQYLRSVVNVILHNSPDLAAGACKAILSTVAPFFGELMPVNKKKSRFRIGKQSGNENNPPEPPPPTEHYNGL